MPVWIRKLFATRWTRRSQWSRLLLCQREFQRVLSKERSRVDRHGGLFGFIILRLCDMQDAKAQIKLLAKLLHRRLRDTDEKGHLGPGRVGIVLPATDSIGTSLVLTQILEIAKLAGLAIDGEAFVYPDQDLDQRKQQSQKSLSDSSSGSSAENAETSEVPGEAVEPVDAVRPLPAAMFAAAYPPWKRALDIVGASTGLLIASPIMIASALLIKATSPGPILFCQRRTGYLGKEFTILKFRSMVMGAEDLQSELRERNERDGPAFKITRDPRTTLVGRFLRATGFDELPQLYNVLRGDMALVGPRPLPVEEAAQCLPWQKRRVDIKPGLTCFWQIAKSRNISFPDWMRLDLHYVRSASFILDLRLLARTVIAVFLGRVGH